jgi:hypothetical protein
MCPQHKARFHTENAEDHGEPLRSQSVALRAKRMMLSLWLSVVLGGLRVTACCKA